MTQKAFAEKVRKLVTADEQVIGLAAAGSWISNELDEFSDLDLILVTKDKIAGDKEKMMGYARSFGELISGFTGEHVGEPRVLICLYDNPLLHVDIKFLTLPEFSHRIENPVLLFERDGQLTDLIQSTVAKWPELDYQWIEDRFWTWIHYACLKIGRGELMEALDFLSFLRLVVLSPLLQVKNKQLPRGLRKVEQHLAAADLEKLTLTVAQYSKASVIAAIDNSIVLYRSLRDELFPGTTALQSNAEQQVTAYFDQLKNV